jgi:predicted HTH transcriptional regulator
LICKNTCKNGRKDSFWRLCKIILPLHKRKKNLEIKSPGCLYSGEKEAFVKGKANAKWRNPSFSYLFNKLKWTQFEGQGIPTVLKMMRTEGYPAPIFELESESVTCILHSK